MKVSWNSRNEELVGLAMTSAEMQTLQDVYNTISSDSKTRVLQSLWHFLIWFDLRKDIIGPYYTSASTLKSKFLLLCVMDAIYQFHLFSFEMSLTLVIEPAPIWLCWRHFVGEKEPTFMITLKATSFRFQFHLKIHTPVGRSSSWFAHLTRYMYIMCIMCACTCTCTFVYVYFKHWKEVEDYSVFSIAVQEYDIPVIQSRASWCLRLWVSRHPLWVESTGGPLQMRVGASLINKVQRCNK